MKKRKWIAIVLAAALLAGCGAVGEQATGQQETESVYVTDQDPGFSTPSTTGRDLTVQVKTFDTKKYKKQIKNAKAAYGTLDYRYSTLSIRETNRDATEIVRCRVDKTEFMSCNGDAYTKLDVTVLDSCKGNLRQGDRISVAVFGGYITEYENKIAYEIDSKRSKKELQNTVLEMKSVDTSEERFPKSGDEYVIALRESILFPNMYRSICDYLAMWRLDADGKYTRQPDKKAKENITDKGNSIESFTLDWFKAELEKTATSE